MQEERAKNTNSEPDENGEEQDGNSKNLRSGIEFPYGDLDKAIEVAKAIHDNAGRSCGHDQLAAFLKMTANSGGYRARIAPARIFGLIETERGQVTLTDLGRKIVDPTQERVARAEAFLKVPLYKALYDGHRGQVLPGAKGLESEIQRLGVSPKQTDKARQVFERSALQAGYFAHGKDRLVAPVVAGAPPPKTDEKIDEKKKLDGGNGGDGGSLVLDPLLIALLKKIPPASEDWPAATRVRWFRAFAMNVSQVYDDDDAPVELKIDEVKGQ